MKILYVSSEAFPFCKTGGLADVAGSLPSALARNGDQVAVILPLYGQIGQQWRQQMTFRRYIYVDLGWRHQYCGLFSLEKDGVTWYFVDNEHYFCRGALYGEYDDGERFAFFCKAVIDLLPSLDWMPSTATTGRRRWCPSISRMSAPAGRRCAASARCSLSTTSSIRDATARTPWTSCSGWIAAGTTTAPSRWTAM